MEDDGGKFIEESIFIYIRSIDETTRLMVYNSSNITGLEGLNHRGSKVIVEVPDGCMIVFTSETVHDGVNFMNAKMVLICLIFVCLLILLKKTVFQLQIFPK